MQSRAARRRRWINPVMLAALLLAGACQARPVVIYDSGNTEPVAPYLEILDAVEAAPGPVAPPRPQIDAADPAHLLPIRSPGLTPGDVARRPFGRPISRPFFLIGSDRRSRAWLSAHAGRLREIGAAGMLVQAETVEDLAAIARLGHGLPIMPASGSDIARALGIRHYPALVSREGIEQ